MKHKAINVETDVLCYILSGFTFFNVFLHCCFSSVDVHSALDSYKALYSTYLHTKLLSPA